MNTENVYTGDSLTKLCGQENCKRVEGESDWSLRKRAYLKIFKSNPFLAEEILFGVKKESFTKADDMMAMSLFSVANNPLNITEEELIKYVNGFNIDPLSLRGGKQNFFEKNEVVGVDYKTLSKEEFKNRLEKIIESSFSKKQIKERFRSELLYECPVTIYYGTLTQEKSLKSATGAEVTTTIITHPEGDFALGW